MRTVLKKKEVLLTEKEKNQTLYMQNVDLNLTRGSGRSYHEFSQNGDHRRQRLGSDSSQTLSMDTLQPTQEVICGDLQTGRSTPKLSSNLLKKSKISRFFRSKHAKKSRDFEGNFPTELLYSRGEKKKAEKRKMAKRIEYLNYLKTCSMFNRALLHVAYSAFKQYQRSHGLYFKTFRPVMIFKDNKVQKYYEKLDRSDLDLSVDSSHSRTSQFQLLSNTGRNKAFKVEKRMLTGIMLSSDSSTSRSNSKVSREHSRHDNSTRFLPQINGSGTQGRSTFLGGTVDLSTSESLQSLRLGSPQNSTRAVSSFKVIASRNKVLRSTPKKKRYNDFLRASADSQNSKDPDVLKERARKIHKFFRRRKNNLRIENKIFDPRLLMATPTPVDNHELCSGLTSLEDLHNEKYAEKTQEEGRSFCSFLGKDKSKLKAEKEKRLRRMKKRKHDASAALMTSLGHRIERYGKKILISCKGVSSSKR